MMQLVAAAWVLNIIREIGRMWVHLSGWLHWMSGFGQ